MKVSSTSIRVTPISRVQSLTKQPFYPKFVDDKGKKMYKILVMMRMTGSLEGGRAAAMQLIEFDNLAQAQKALGCLTAASLIDTKVVALW